MQPGLIVLHANKLESLRDVAVAWLRQHPLAPLENETVLVQSNGMAQWLKFALAKPVSEGGLGICAAVEALMPLRFMWHAYRAVLGESTVPRELLFDKSRLVWRLMRLLPRLLQDDDFALLRHYLLDDAQGRRRYELALVLADLFDQYQVYRAEWLSRWVSGQEGEESRAQPWQPKLWRALLADLPEHLRYSSRSAVHARFITALARLESAPAGLPRRIVVFGISSLPAQTLEALAHLSRFSQVLLCVLNPCRHYWGDIIDGRELFRASRRRQADKPGLPAGLDPAALHAEANPLLAAWGKQGRDYVRLLDEYDDTARYREHVSAAIGRIDLFEDYPGETAATTLQQVQQAILELDAAPPTVLDDSIVFHAAHSPQREVEILHDQLLARLDADPALKPFDIMVMVPDISVYAPHIRAVFGRHKPDERTYIPFTLADENENSEAVLRAAVESLLGLPQGRLTLEEGLDLLEVPALARRYDLAEADVALLHDALQTANVRWGLDADQRRAQGMTEGLAQNSWQFGLERLLLGYAAGAEALWLEVAGDDSLSGLSAEALGGLAEFMQAVKWALARLAGTYAPAEWAEVLRAVLTRFFAPDDGETDFFDRLLAQIDSWREACELAQLTEPLSLAVVRQALFDALDAPRLSQRFFGGGVHFSTLMPMRAIPFKIVCLLGMNDGDYPRIQPTLSFDLMRARPQPGDRSRRDDDQYLFLEALLSARRALYLSWVGRSVRDNSEQPPSVLLARLLDYLGEAAWQQVVYHPLQPYDSAYFTAVSPDLFSYQSSWQAVHQGYVVADRLLPDFVTGEALSLASLQAFLRQPVDAFFHQRLGVRFRALDEELEEHEPFALNKLQQHMLGRELIEAASMAGWDDNGWQRAGHRLRSAGTLPVGGFADRALAELLSPSRQVVKRIGQWQERYPRELPPQEITVQLAGNTLEDWLAHLRQDDKGNVLAIDWQPQALDKAKAGLALHKLVRLWVSHLAGCAAGLKLTSVMLGADREVQLPPLRQKEAAALLQALTDAWRQGMSSPLPVACKTAFAWLTANRSQQAEPQGDEFAWQAAHVAYEGGKNAFGELAESTSLQKCYPQFAAMPRAAFSHWVEVLYAPLFERMGESDGQGDETGGEA